MLNLYLSEYTDFCKIQKFFYIIPNISITTASWCNPINVLCMYLICGYKIATIRCYSLKFCCWLCWLTNGIFCSSCSHANHSRRNWNIRRWPTQSQQTPQNIRVHSQLCNMQLHINSLLQCAAVVWPIITAYIPFGSCLVYIYTHTRALNAVRKRANKHRTGWNIIPIGFRNSLIQF